MISSGYNIWRDTKKPALLLNYMCLTSKIVEPVYAADFTSVVVAGVHFDCDPDVIDFVKNSMDISHRKARHESREEYIRQNTALAVLHEWGKKINPVRMSEKFYSFLSLLEFYIETCFGL